MAARNSVNSSIIGNLSEFGLKKADWNNYIEQKGFFFKQMVLKMIIKGKLYCLVHEFMFLPYLQVI